MTIPEPSRTITFGVDTFGSLTREPDGSLTSQAQTLRDIVAEGQAADRARVDVFSVGEHHRPDYAVSAPDIVLAGLATSTERIRLGSAVVVLSSDDPVRVGERFSSIQAMSGGRAEITVGRGSFIESFPLFGLSLDDYEVLFEEKLDLLAKILQEDRVTWSGTTRGPLKDQRIEPALEQPLPAWVAVGGSPASVVRAAQHRMNLMLAIIGGPAERFVPYVNLFHEANEQLGHGNLPVGLHSPGHIAETDEQARAEVEQGWLRHRNQIGRERGWGPAGTEEFRGEIEHGALYVGSPETVARKIAHTLRVTGADRFDLKYDTGTESHAAQKRAIELYGTEVIPRVRELLAEGDGAEA
ncbi:LLM class flavin-dependent oxidoreductase [Brachybacterium huguangmaarense]